MGANSANGKIYISAEVIDNFKQLASEVKNGLSQAAKEAKLEIEVDDKSTQQAIETSLKNINNYLSKAKFKKIDYGKILPNFNDFLGDESITGNDKLIATDALEQTLSNIDKYGSKIHQSLINSLDADGVQKYFKQLNSVMEYLVDNFSSNYEQLFNTIATDKGFNFDALFNLDTLVKGKNGYLVEDYFGTVDDLKKNIAKEYKKYDSFGLSDAEYMASLEKIAGLKSALETVTGDGLKDILNDKDLADDINAAVNSIEHDYGKAVADAIKRIELNVSNMILDSLDNMHDIQNGIKSYDINSILNTDNYYNSELDKFFKRKVKEQKTPSAEDVINKTIKGEKEPTDYSYIYDNETEAAERLKSKIEEVHKAIDNKTSALETEKDKMSEVVNAEIKELTRLEKKFGSITNQDYSNTPLLTDEGGELFTVYRLVSNMVNPHSPNPHYGGTDFTTTNPDMAKGMHGSNWKQYKANFKAKNPLVLDARNNPFYSLPEDLVENYDTKTQFLLNQLKKEAKSAIKDFNLEFGAQLNFGGDFEFYDSVYGDILESNDDYKDYFDRIITASENKEKIITDAAKKIKDIQKKLQDKQKEIISNDTLPHWDDFPEGKTHGLDNDMLARWLQTQDVYDAIILKNIEDSSEHGGGTVLGTNVLLKDFNKQAYNVSLNDAGGSDAYLKTVEEEVASVYSKVEEKIDSIASKLDAIKFPVNIAPEIVVDKESVSKIKINDIVSDDLGTYVEDFVATVQEKLSNHYIEDVLDFLAYDNDGKFITSNGGHQNDGIYQDDKITAIIRDAEYEGKVKALMPALEEAHKKGANVARILDYIIDDENNLLEIQETASGKLIGGNDDDGEWLEATDEQILKLIKDFKILQETGLYFDTGGKNLLYDKDKGFSIIDLAKPKDKNNIPSYNTNDPADLYEYFNSYGSTLGFSQKLKQNLKLSKKAETKSLDYSSDTSEMLNELADSIDKKIEETFESKKQTLQKALDLIKSKDILLEEDGTFEGFSIESIKEELQNVIDNIDSGAAIPTGIMNYYHEKAQKIIDSAKDLKGLFGELYEEDENEEFEIDSVTEFEADFTDISEPLSTAIDKKVDKVIEEKKEKIQEAAKILESLNSDEYYNDYYDDIEASYSSLEYFFSHADNFDENEIYKEAQKLIDKYNSLNKIIPEKISSDLSDIEKTIPSIGDFAKSIHSKVLTSDEIDGVLSGGEKGKNPFSKPSWLKPAKPTPTKTSIDTAKAKEEVTEANKDLEKSTSPSIEALNKESLVLEKIEDNASKAALKKEEFAKAESLVYGATEKTTPMLDDEDTMFANLDASISNAAASLNNFAEAHNKINRLNDINANIQIDNNDNNSQNNSRDNNRNINNKTKPYSSLEQIPNEDIIKNYEDIGGALPNIINKNLKGAINKLDAPSFEDLLDEGYQSYRQSLIRMFESMSEDDLISEYGNIIGDDLNKSITSGIARGIDSIDFDNTSDILLSKLMEEQREINEAEENYINSINNVEKQYSKLSESKSYYTGSDVSVFDLKKYTDKDIDPKGRINQATILSKELSKVKKELNNEFNDEGKISGSVNEDRVKHIQELINKYNDLIDKIKQLKDIIKSPESIENIELDLKKQANTVQKQLQSGKYEKFSKQTLDTINKYSYYDAGGNITGQTAPQINELKKELENYNSIIEKIKTANTDQQFIKLGEEAKEAQLKIKELTEDLKEISSPVATKNQTTSLAKQISGFMDKNTRISVEARSELQSYFNTLMSGASVSSDALNNMAQRFKEVKIAEEQAGRLGGDIFNQMVGKMREGIAYLTTKVSAYEIFNQFRQGFEIIHQFDDALTEMMKVSDETRTSLQRYQKTTFETADAIGTSALQIQNSTADFMRLGETLNQAAESAKSANVLMNVSEFQSIDEATKSLIAMGAAYNDLSKMNIIDKLNEVGNNYSISTSEAAEALQSSASALKTAGNDMDEALALITAGNAVVQDANKVGTGMRTIALRLTGTKSAKEELEEMGEETENVITTQSKLRDTIKEATAVASNGFKGFDILDDNGNYKSTYEIMLGIADVYNEILETDKQFGRNNANLLLESVAGKNRANIAASIFQNPQLLRDAYQSSEEANGSAMRENDKYVQSISGHLAQLTNAWQQMWANAANRDVINFFIDAAKAVVNFANAVGILPATLGLMLPYIEIITRAKSGKGIVSSFLNWANGLNEAQKAAKAMKEAQEGLNATQEAGVAINAAKTASEEAKTAATIEATGAELAESAADATGVASSTAKTASNEAETLSVEEQAIAYTQLGAAEEAEKVVESGGVFAKISGGIDLLKGAFTGLVSTIGAVPLAMGAAAVVLFAAKKAYDAHRESVFADAKATAENIKTQQEATSQQIESYKQLKTQLDSGDLSEQETINVKQQILDIQKSITEQYGTAAQGVDLINGKLEEQVDLLDSISQKEAQDQYFKDYEGFQVAEQEYNKNNRSYNIGLNNTGNANLDKAITDELLKNGFRIQAAGMGTFNASVKGTASDGINALENTKKALEELKAEYRDRDTLEVLNKQIAEIEEQISKAYEVVDKYEATALRGLELDLAGNDTNGYDIYKNYQSSVSNLEDAYISGDTKKINEARKAFDEATKAKEDFFEIKGNEQFTLLFNQIDTSLIDTKNKFRDTVELLKDIPQPDSEEGLFETEYTKRIDKNTKAKKKNGKETDKVHKAAEKLYKLNPDKVDIKATLDNNTYASGKYADALNTLMNEMGWTTAEADEMINALVTAGIVHGDASDIAYIATDSYNVFSSSVENAVAAVNSLNTALSESAKGTGLTEQTLTELRNAFGDNLDSVLEKTANGYHLNTEGAYLLRQQQEALVSADYASAVYEQYQALDKLQEGYNRAKKAGEDTSGFAQQRKAIQDNIDKLNEQLMTFNNANSAYQTWLAKQSSEGEREMYNSIYSGYDAVKDELDRGWAGEKTRSWLDLIFNDENDDSFDAWISSAEEVKEKFEEVTKDIEGTGGYSIADFFTVDENGKSTSLGVWNFFDAIENKQKEVGKEFIKIGKDGEKIFDFTKNGDYQIADLLGMDIESVHAVLRAAADAGFEVHLDQPLFSLEQLTEKATAAKKALEETSGTKLKINLDPQSEDEVDSAMQKLTDYQQALSEDTSIDPKVKTEKLQQVADIMNFLAAKKREFVEGKVFDIKLLDSKELEKSKKDINDITNKLSNYSKTSGKTEFADQFTIDPMLLNNVDYLQSKMETLKEIKPNVDDTQVQYLDQLLAQLQYRINILNDSNIGETVTVDQLMAAEQIVGDINTKLDYAAQHKDIEFNWDADEEFKEDLNTIASLPEEIKQKWGLEPDATGEELLELVKNKKGELHINVEATGNVPKAEDFQPSTPQKGSTITNTEIEEIKYNVSAAMDTTVFDQGKQHVDQGVEETNQKTAKPKIGLDNDTFIEKQNDSFVALEELDKYDATPNVTLTGLGGVVSVAESMKSTISSIKGKTVDVVVNATSNGLSTLKDKVQGAINKINELKNKKVDFANGTAHAYGTAFARGSVISGSAFASGDWGTSKDQTALTGELGTEIVVFPDGHWQTVGDTGAEFVHLPKGSIVFNHKQSEELLENGYVTSNKGRGKLVGFASGTAFSYGTDKGAIKPTVSSKGMGGSTTSKNNNKGNKDTSKDKTKHKKKNNNTTNKEANKTKNTLDEVEILISRIERQIANLDKTIGNTYTKWSTRNIAIKNDLAKVAQEIKDQNKAYTTYIKKANSVGLDAAWKKKVQSGKFKIEDVTDDKLWQKIQDYQNYYNKALAAKDAVIDLKQKEGELYKQRFDNEQTYYEERVADIQHYIDLLETYNDTLSESGELSSGIIIQDQISRENARLEKLNKEYDSLITLRNDAVKSGKIKKYSEAWYEMTSSIQEVSESIAEANNNLITYANNLRQLDWDRWDKVHNAIGGVNNELEFLYDLFNSDDFFDDQGDLTDQGVTAFALLAQQYDTYFREAQEYQKEIEATEALLSANNGENKYDQNLVDKLKDLKEAQQDSISNAKKMKDSMVDLTEDGIKKQIDYIKDLIEDYEDLLETQKDQTDYAKKVADQQKEINKLEKQYRAIQNDTSEEGATKRQKLRDQINEKRQDLKDTQDDRRISETKDMLSDFQESFEEFLDNKLKDVEGVVREVINRTNANGSVINDTITTLANSYGYTPSNTLKDTLSNLSNNLVSYFSSAFDNDKVNSIVHGVDAIVDYYNKAQADSEAKGQASANEAMAKQIKETGTHIQSYIDKNGDKQTGFFDSEGKLKENYTGFAQKDGKQYLFTNGSINKKNQWYTDKAGKKYYLDKSGATKTGWQTIEGKKYYLDPKQKGAALTGWQTIDKKRYYFDANGKMYKGLKTIGNKKYYFDSNGVLLKGTWRKINNKQYYLDKKDGHVLTGKQTINGKKYTFNADGTLKKNGWKKGTASVPKTGMAWTNEGYKAEAIIRKSDGAILTPLNKGDSVIPSNAMKNMYRALTDPEKYLKQYTTPDVKIIQGTGSTNNQSPTINMQFIANGVQDANKFVNDLMNNKKLEKWIQEVTLGQANGHNSYKKYSYAIR